MRRWTGSSGCEVRLDGDGPAMITGRQIREARMMLGWSGEALCLRARVDNAILTRAEGVDGTPSITLHQAALIQQALERAGIRFGRGGAVLIDRSGKTSS